MELVISFDKLQKIGFTKQKLRSGATVAVVYNEANNCVYAIDNVCPHKQASLLKGDIEDLGAEVSKLSGDGSAAGGLCLRCPKHRKKFNGGLYFNLMTGKPFVRDAEECSHFKPWWRQRTYRASVVAGNVYVAEEPQEAPTQAHEEVSSSSSATSQETWVDFKVAAVQKYNHDSGVYRFVPVDQKQCARTFQTAVVEGNIDRWSWHVSLRLLLNAGDANARSSSSVSREYTPVSSLQALLGGEYVDMLVKIYPDGALTSRLLDVKVGDLVEISTPTSTLVLPSISLPGFKEPVFPMSPGCPTPLHVALLCGGTGIAPILQVLRSALNIDPQNPFRQRNLSPSLWLLFSNRTEADILLREAIEELQSGNAHDLHVLHTLTDANPPSNWKGATGRINVEMLRWLPEVFFSQCEPARAVVCGPSGFYSHVAACLVRQEIDLLCSGDSLLRQYAH
eukprot:NODE_1878_length_1580_cov_33.048730_g1788_i0.p1 GENE.NODE_1878_length_1580_cov_33.048730_g1788_i0~~NODE_1878_length_1580_cov_33.048730_g1788_i0.p1  ORF type:complete len:471 (+),score=80.54 NODE_1878_length_1580_cov_33.048730_g1788_i0:61-1413(+)